MADENATVDIVDETKPEEPPTEIPKFDEPPAEVPKSDEPSAEVPKSDEPPAEVPKSDEPPAEVPKSDEPPAEIPKSDEPPAEVPKSDEPPAEVPKSDEPPAEVPKSDEPPAEVPKSDEPPAEVPKSDEPSAEVPKSDEPPADVPKKVDAPLEEPPTLEPTEKTEDVPKSKPKRTKVYSIDPSDPVEICMGDDELTRSEPETVGQLFKRTVERFGSYPALAFKDQQEASYTYVTYKEYYDLCVRTAKSFLKLELEPFHGVGILGFNSPEWFYSALGAMFAGGLATGIYATNNPDTCQYILSNCKANIVVVENDKQLQKILQIRDALPDLKAIVQYKGKLSGSYPDVYEWGQFLELGDSVDAQIVEDKIAALKPGHCASLIYTSGTTGNPKGVMLSHDNITYTCKCFFTAHGSNLEFGGERVVSYLPLSHIAGQIVDMYMMLYCGSVTYFAQPDALKGTLRITLLEARPTLFFGVPRVWEKFMIAIKANTPTGGFKQKLGAWAKGKAFQGHMNMMNKTSVPWGWTIANIVLKKAREALGLTETKVFASGAAPMRREIKEFFMGLNMPICDVIGMSECTGPGIMNIIRPGEFKIDSVGRVLIGTEAKLDYSASSEEGQGELCYRGRSVMMGYYNNEQKTKETIDEDGWLHSGDLATVDKDEFYYITGRIKELIITSGGENIAPVPIEDRVKQELPFISQVFLVGEQRNFLSCLLTLQCVVDLDTQEPSNDLTPEAIKCISLLGSTATKVSEIIENKDRPVFDAIQQAIDKANEGAVSGAQKIQKWSILDTDFSIPGGEFGPTLKIRRFYVLQKYKDTIDSLYEQPKPQ